MPFGMQTWVGPLNDVLDGGLDHSREQALLGLCKVSEIPGVRSMFSTLFGKWQHVLSLSLLQQLSSLRRGSGIYRVGQKK